MKRAIITLAIGLVVAGGWCVFACCGEGQQLEWKVYDWHMRRSRPRPWTAGSTRIRVIAIDDWSVKEQFGPWPWPRLRHGQLLQVLATPKYRPAAVAFDVSFPRPSATAPQWDAAFVQKVQAHGGVVLGYRFDELDTRPGRAAATQAALPPGLEKMRLDWNGRRGLWRGVGPNPPWPQLADAGWSGFYDAPRDDDGVLRRIPLVIQSGGRAAPSLALATVLRDLGCEPEKAEVAPGRYVQFTPPGRARVRIPIDRHGCALIRYPGPWAGMDVTPFAVVIAQYVHATTQPAAAQALAEFKDSVAFVGMTYEGVPDVLSTPLQRSCPGVAVHAAMAWTILNGAFLREAPLWMDLAFVLLVSVIAGSLATWAPVRFGAPVAPVLMAAAWGGSYSAFIGGYVLWTLAPILAGGTSFAVLMTYRQVFTESRRRRLRKIFSQYLSPEAVREIVNVSDQHVLAARQMEAVVLFSDIRGFTTLSERLGPVAIVDVLNEYFEAMTEIIQRHGGAVNKFVGDAIFATFGVPIRHADDARRAVRAAIEMQQRLARMREVWRAQGRPEFRIGIGISRGEVVAGTIGSERRKDSTAIGDAVNVGARLEELTKEFKEQILVSQAIWDEVKDEVQGTALGETSIRGRAAGTHIHAITVPEGPNS